MKTLTLDIETTGLTPKGAAWEKDFKDFPHIVSLAYKLDDGETRYFIIKREGWTIPEDVIALHGITNEMCDESPHKLVDVFAEMAVMAMESEVTVGHNIYFDSSIIKANVLRMVELNTSIDQKIIECIFKLLDKERRVDTMQKTISFCNIQGTRGAKWPKLTELHQKLFNEGFEAHNSKEDVDATYRCYVELKARGII